MLTSSARTSFHLRPITLDDARLLIDWRNRPTIRQVMFTTGEIDWTEHIAWLERTIASDRSHAFIFEQQGIPLGYVKLDRTHADRMSWGFYIGAVDAPAGSGSRMLFLALDEAFGPLSAKRIEASVRADNAASLHVHAKLGFQRLNNGPEKAAQHFEIDRSGWHHARIALSKTLFANSPQSGG